MEEVGGAEVGIFGHGDFKYLAEFVRGIDIAVELIDRLGGADGF